MKIDSTKATRDVVSTLQRICAELPGAEQYVMVHHPAFRVGKKPFVIVGMDEGTKGATLSVNLGREAQATFLDDERFSRTPYIGQHGWVTVPQDKLAKGELTPLVVDSWRRVATKKQLALHAGGPRERREPSPETRAIVNRWSSAAGDVTAWLDAENRTPRLVLSWSPVDGWTDEGSFAFEQILAPDSHARRVVAHYLGDATLLAITEAVTATREPPGEKPRTATRTWARTVARGFCSGDLDDVDWVIASVDGVRGGGYTHSYGDRSGEGHWTALISDFMDPTCGHRVICASVLPRIDAYLQLAVAGGFRPL